MMKHFATIIFFLFLNSAFGQNELNGIWIGENLEYLSVKDDEVLIEFQSFPDKFKYRIKKNQLILISNYEYSTGTRDSIYFVPDSTLYHFDYKLINKDSLQLNLNKVSGRISSNPKKQYNYNRKSSLKKTEINFQSIFFSGTTCLGTCPKMKIEIDSLGNAKFEGEYYTKPFIGNYIGKLTSKQLELLVEILNRSELDRFPEKLRYLIDMPNFKFIFRYDNKEKRSRGSLTPNFNREIVNYLLTIYKEIEWTEVDYEIEFNE
ncbi:MAG: DUF6438 domain-containing protein [Psychroserpens sp.]|uniref:DUF6438 domain-containing protein n=1 Tax=Psychroserpens sp. TaxID=2020870 RepID=UPI003003987B